MFEAVCACGNPRHRLTIQQDPDDPSGRELYIELPGELTMISLDAATVKALAEYLRPLGSCSTCVHWVSRANFFRDHGECHAILSDGPIARVRAYDRGFLDERLEVAFETLPDFTCALYEPQPDLA